MANDYGELKWCQLGNSVLIASGLLYTKQHSTGLGGESNLRNLPCMVLPVIHVKTIKTYCSFQIIVFVCEYLSPEHIASVPGKRAVTQKTEYNLGDVA